MTEIDKAIFALECCIESDETAECPPGCPFGDDPECEIKAKMFARDVLKTFRNTGRVMEGKEDGSKNT